VIRVTWNEGAWRRWTDDLVEQQIPFATALALTWTARDARTQLKADLPATFTIRSGWVAKGIRFEKARKTDDPIAAEVGHLDDYMKLQAEGGTRQTSTQSVAVPVGIRKTPQTRTTPAKWPRRLLRKRKHFIAPLSASISTLGLFRRRGGRRNPRLDLLYVMAERAVVPKRWPLEETVEQVVADVWPENARKALEKALASGRRRR